MALTPEQLKRIDNIKAARANDPQWRQSEPQSRPSPNGKLPAPPPEPIYRMQPQRMNDILAKRFAPVKWVLPGFIPEGCTLLAGKTKLGKSFFVVALSHAVTSGGQFLGQQCEQRGVLYVSLEDNERRLNERGNKLSPTWSDDMFIETRMANFDHGGLADLERVIKENPRIGVVFIDCLAAIMGLPRKGETTYFHEYRTLAAFRDLANRTGTSIIIVHHVKKKEEAEVFDAILGTTGLSAAVDTGSVMLKPDPDGPVRWAFRGRDVVWQDKVLDADLDQNHWELIGDYEPNPEASNTRQRIIAHLKAAKCSLTPKQVAEGLGIAEVTVRQQLKRMSQSGKVSKTSYGSYTCQ